MIRLINTKKMMIMKIYLMETKNWTSKNKKIMILKMQNPKIQKIDLKNNIKASGRQRKLITKIPV